MEPDHPVVLLHTLSTLALVGLIWVVQIVVYPLFARLPRDFVDYHARYTARITFVVAPLMFVELGTVVALTLSAPSSWTYAGAALCSLNWLSTFLIQVPIHGRLSTEFDPGEIRRLATTNWLRTISWSARGGLALWIPSIL